MESRSLKRKLGSTVFVSSRKKLKQVHRARKTAKQNFPSISVTADNLPWKTIRTQGDVGVLGDEADGGMLELEEVEGVEVVYGDGEAGKIVGFRIKGPVPAHGDDTAAAAHSETGNAREESALPNPIVIDSFDASTLLPAWVPYPLHSALLRSIHKRGFEHPTAIQQRTFDVFLGSSGQQTDGSDTREDSAAEVPSELRQRDIVGIAETGSGKTLAYGLPILHHILTALTSRPNDDASDSASQIVVNPPIVTQRRQLQALVLAPTRELALQVSEHLNACLDQLFAAQSSSVAHVDGEKRETPKQKPPPAVSVAAIVGGMSAQKQRRILSRGVDILVATAGRFWDLCGEDPSLTAQLRSLRFLVLDEADRMVEAGHFQELDGILRMTARPPPDMDTAETISQDPPAPLDIPFAHEEVAQERNDALQTFVFSATMSKDLQRDLKRRRRSNTKRKGESASTLDDLLMKLDFRDPNPVIIDLSPEGGRVEGLQESKVECLANDKDAYLYYFLLRHPGRSLVFLASIDGIRRLMPILELLKLNVWPLHSGLQQKQRLKNFDRFKSTANSVLLATDVAARGLDVPAVDHVIHYQVPRSADAYVHRNGRTARAMQKGFGLVLCAPDERRVFRGVLAGLGRAEDDVPELTVEHDLLDKLKGRVQLARKIDSAAHRVKKETHDRNWMRETAEAMEIIVGSDLESNASEDAPRASRKRHKEAKLARLKGELKQALSQPLVARGVSTRYITSGSRAVVDDLIEGENHETMLGLQKVKAGSEVVRKKKRDSKRKAGEERLAAV